MDLCKPTADADFYVGATRAVNNAGEMQGLIEALFLAKYLCGACEQLQAYRAVMVTVDSQCVKGLLEEKFVAREKLGCSATLLLTHVASDEKAATT